MVHLQRAQLLPDIIFLYLGKFTVFGLCWVWCRRKASRLHLTKTDYFWNMMRNIILTPSNYEPPNSTELPYFSTLHVRNAIAPCVWEFLAPPLELLAVSVHVHQYMYIFVICISLSILVIDARGENAATPLHFAARFQLSKHCTSPSVSSVASAPEATPRHWL